MKLNRSDYRKQSAFIYAASFLRRSHVERALMLLGVALSLVLAATGRADTISSTATANATIQPAGPRAGGTGNGSNFFNIEGSSNNANASFGVVDFSTTSFGLNFSVLSVGSSFTLSLTESDQSFTKAGSLNFYLTTDTTTAFSALKFDATNPPGGVGTQLTPLTLLNSSPLAFNSNGTTNTGQVDTYTLTLTSALQSYVLNQFNTGGNLRFVIAAATVDVAATFGGATNSATSNRQLLSFNATLNQPTLTWTGGSGNWNAPGTANDTSWSGSGWVAGNKAAFSNLPAGTVTLTSPNTASDIVFNTTGYTVAGSAANPLTLTSGSIQVANATDSATISAVLAGTAGITKTGPGLLTLSGANTYSGLTAINAGVVSVSNDGNLGAAANGVTLNGGTLRTGAALTLGSARTLSGSGTLDMAGGALTVNGPVNAGTLTLANGNATLAGSSITIATLTVNTGNSLTINGPLVATTGAPRTTLTGAGSVVFNGDNSAYTGGITINPSGPTLTINSATSLGGGQFRFNGGALVASTPLTGGSAIRTEFSVGGNVTIGGTSPIELAGTFGFFGTASKTITIDAPLVTLSGSITPAVTGTNSVLNKAGAGRLILSGTNSGSNNTTVTGGALEVAANATLPRGDITITALPAANVSLQLDDNLTVDSLSNILLNSNGSGRALLNLNYVSTTATNTMEIINGLVLDGVVQPVGVYNATTSPGYIIGTGSLMVTNLSPVPEPSTWALLGLSFGALGMLKLRRRGAV